MENLESKNLDYIMAEILGGFSLHLQPFFLYPKNIYNSIFPILKSEKSKKVIVSAFTRPLLSYITATHSPPMHAPLSSQSSHHTHSLNTPLKPDAHKPRHSCSRHTHTLISLTTLISFLSGTILSPRALAEFAFNNFRNGICDPFQKSMKQIPKSVISYFSETDHEFCFWKKV